jgi:hypothetical protein
MESFLKLLEDESSLHFYIRKCLKYLIILFSAIVIYSKLGGEFRIDKVFSSDGDSLNLKILFEELLSKKSFFPIIFVFLANSIFSLTESIIRLIFFGLTQFFSEKWFEKGYEELDKIEKSQDIGMAQFLEFILQSVKKVKFIYRFVHLDVKKIIKKISSFNSTSDFDEWSEELETNFNESLDRNIEVSLISIFILYIFESSSLSFIHNGSILYWICKVIVFGYPIVRLLMIVFITFYYRLATLFITAGDRYLELKSHEANLK